MEVDIRLWMRRDAVVDRTPSSRYSREMRQLHGSSDRTVGVLSAIAAFTLWGVFPLYWAYLSDVPAVEITTHRVAWAALLAWAIVLFDRRANGSRSGDQPLLPRGRVLALLVLNGVLVVTNWLIYIWAVTNGRTLDASLGYYINPLVSIFLGMVVFRERLSALQWVSLASAAIGVLYLTVRLGIFPWVSIALALTFGTYGLIKKRTPLTSIHSLSVELLPLSLPALTAIAIPAVVGRGSFLTGNAVWSLFLFGGGAVTVAPLLLFGMAAQRIRLADVGFLQYITPTMLFILAVVVFDDPMPTDRLVGFVFVWIGLVLYTISNLVGVGRGSQA